MFSVYLKDGSQKNFEKPVSGLILAESISKSLAKKAICIFVGPELCDLSRQIPDKSQVEIITREDPRALEVIRHDCAHILAEAVKTLYPDVQITIGPAIENGFYYDIYRETPFIPEDLEKIEAKMKQLVDEDLPFTREEWTRQDAIDFFKKQGEFFKTEIIEDLPENEIISVYKQGHFIDLCRGPHMPSTGYIGKAFKLTKISGAYWRGDSTKPMLQRIYGTAWANEEQLKNYLYMLEEAEKRDHRKLGQQLDLFHLQEEAPGAVFWHPKGWTLFRLLQNYIRSMLEKNNYVEVNTPQLVHKKLWEASGHCEKFLENMFIIPDEANAYVVKPMNCPCHVQIFKQGIKSYRDLPIRMAEFGCCHRNEAKGALHGLMRVRAFVQDDAHIFCTPDQIVNETKDFCTLLKNIYKDLGFEDIHIKFSDRPEKRAGSDEIWDKAEKALEEASMQAGLSWSLNKGEGAFYGPKLEFHLKDAIGRSWQCGTFQVDFVLPERLDAHYIDEDNSKKRPVMLHRAILGTFERFIGILIEHCAGKFPIWLTPIQAVVTTVITQANDYAKEIFSMLKKNGVRCELDIRNEKISYKIREHSLQKIPFILIIGKKEIEDKTVTVRSLGSQEQITLSVGELAKHICQF